MIRRALLVLLLLGAPAQAAYVTLDGSGNVTGIFASPQPQLSGFATISDSDSRIAVFEAPALAQGTLAAKLGAGIVITSTSTSALNATYALDPLTTSQIEAVAQGAAAGLGLPGGGSTFTYPDASNTPHTFTAAQIEALYQADRDMVLQLTTQAGVMAHGGTPTWPTQSATIP